MREITEQEIKSILSEYNVRYDNKRWYCWACDKEITSVEKKETIVKIYTYTKAGDKLETGGITDEVRKNTSITCPFCHVAIGYWNDMVVKKLLTDKDEESFQLS